MTSKKITFAMAMDWEKGFVNGIQDDQDMEQFRSEKSVTIKKVSILCVAIVFHSMVSKKKR